MSEDMGVGENGAKMWNVQEYSLAHPKFKLQKNIYELKDHVGKKY